MLGADRTIADDKNVLATFDGIHSLGAERGQLRFYAFFAPCHGVANVQRLRAEFALCQLLNVAQLCHVLFGQYRLADLQTHGRIDLVDVQQVGFRPNEADQRHHNCFPNRVDRWVGHLRKQLLEVVVQRFVFARKHSQWAVIAHRADGFLAGLCHRCEQELDVFLRHAKGLLQIQQSRRYCIHRSFGGLSTCGRLHPCITFTSNGLLHIV